LQLHYGGGYTVDYSPSEFSFYKENGFDRVKAINFALIGEPGTPELPAVYLNYIIPSNTKVESLIVLQSNVNQISGEYLIYPAQPPHKPGETLPWVPPDTLIYNSNALFPDDFIRVINHGIMDGARIVTIEIRPIQYYPASKTLLLVRNIHFEFCLGSENTPELRAKIRGKYEQSVYDAVLSKVVANDYEVPAYYQKPTLVEENQIGTLAPIPGAPGVIITPSEFFGAFQEYANWMTDQGIRTIMLTPEYIYSVFPNGRDNPEKIRLYMQWCYKYAGGTYFIFGGDDYTVPVRYGIPRDVPPWDPEENDSIPCDLYFSDLSGDWNFDNDDYWGELTHDDADCFSEVFVGRITAYTVDEVENWVTKALHYEKTPGVQFNKALWINDIFYNWPAHDKFPSYFTHKDDNRYPADAALYDIDAGYGFVNLNCHGNIGDFSPHTYAGGRNTIYSWWPDTASQTRAGLNWLTNINKYFFVYAICCHSGAYDQYAKTDPYYLYGSDTCVADAFVDAYLYNHQGDIGPFGACAAVFNTRTPYAAWNELQTYYYDALFRQPEDQDDDTVYSYLGVAQAIAKAMHAPFWSVNWQNRNGAYCPNLFGSPVTEAWTKTPGNMMVTHPTLIPTGVQNFTVTVGTYTIPPTPLQYAKVCLNKTDDIYEVGSTDANGQVTFSITPQYGGPMKVTVTRFHNIESNYAQYRPSETFCEVMPGGGGGGQSAGSNIIAPEHLCITWMPTLIKEGTTIKYGVPEKNKVDLTIYNILGARVSTLRNEKLVPGYYEDMFDARNLASGVYFIVLRQGNEKVSKKFLFIK
jgi:hypothetical protein